MSWKAIHEWWHAVAWITVPLVVALEIVLMMAFGEKQE